MCIIPQAQYFSYILDFGVLANNLNYNFKKSLIVATYDKLHNPLARFSWGKRLQVGL